MKANHNKINIYIIIGVPRSGTTLLRTILNSHSKVEGLPETPWLLGSYGKDTSFFSLFNALLKGEYGLQISMPTIYRQDLESLFQDFIVNLFSIHVRNTGKNNIVIKTPNDIKHIEFYDSLFPEAKFIHITRDGRDVACSTVEKKQQGYFGSLREYGEVNYINSFERWVEWEVKADDFLKNKICHNIRYESLVENPENIIKDIHSFMNLEFEKKTLGFSNFQHRFPDYEAGSNDVKNTKNILRSQVGRWRNDFPKQDLLKVLKNYADILIEKGYSVDNYNNPKKDKIFRIHKWFK